MGPMRKSRLSHYKQGRLIEHFVSGSTVLTATIWMIEIVFICSLPALRKCSAFLIRVAAYTLAPIGNTDGSESQP